MKPILWVAVAVAAVLGVLFLVWKNRNASRYQAPAVAASAGVQAPAPAPAMILPSAPTNDATAQRLAGVAGIIGASASALGSVASIFAKKAG